MYNIIAQTIKVRMQQYYLALSHRYKHFLGSSQATNVWQPLQYRIYPKVVSNCARGQLTEEKPHTTDAAMH